MRYLLKLVIGLALLAVLAETIAHFLIQYEIVASVAEHQPGAQVVTAGVHIPVLPGIVQHRRIPDVRVSARHVDLSTVVADRVTVHAFGLKLRTSNSLSPGAGVTHVDRIDLTVRFTQEELSALLPKSTSFVFGQGTVTLKGLVTSVTGQFAIQPPAKLVFVVQGSPAPGLASAPAIAFQVQPLASCIQSVKLTKGSLTITCEEINPPTTDLLPHK